MNTTDPDQNDYLNIFAYKKDRRNSTRLRITCKCAKGKCYVRSIASFPINGNITSNNYRSQHTRETNVKKKMHTAQTILPSFPPPPLKEILILLEADRESFMCV